MQVCHIQETQWLLETVPEETQMLDLTNTLN